MQDNHKMYICKQERERASNLSQAPTPSLHFKKLYAYKLRIKTKTDSSVYYLFLTHCMDLLRKLISQENLIISCSIFPIYFPDKSSAVSDALLVGEVDALGWHHGCSGVGNTELNPQEKFMVVFDRH